ncbi:MAG: S8 family serine peptidase, partial [Chloroflexi bacterium]|nr:S8 family serine peptidase [Chloroflexota bacterium]
MPGRFKLMRTIAALAFVLSTALFAVPLQASGDPGDAPPPPKITKGNPKLDSKLNQRISDPKASQSPGSAQPNSLQGGDSVRVIIEVAPGQVENVKKAVAGLGAVEASHGDMVQAVVATAQLAAIADVPGVKFVRVPDEPVTDVTISEGVALTNANSWQTGGYTGTGVKVAILDGGFAGYTTRQTEGELPANVTTWWAPSLGGPGTSVHGTAAAEIVYDMAPGAQFYLANFGTEVELGNAVDWLIAQGVNVISASWGYPVGGPGDGTGPITQIVDRARAAGILWVNSAGNSAQRHWEGTFSSTDGDGYHNFTSTDET